MGPVRLVVQQMSVCAPTQLVYQMLTDPTLFVQWMAIDATLDPRPGGIVRWTHANGDTCAGRYVELVPGRRVVFTYGWERADVEIPPGSTTVEIELTPTSDGTTTLQLVHSGLDDPAADAHATGWAHYLGRLRSIVHGTPPGPDPMSTQRVPTPAELGRR